MSSLDFFNNVDGFAKEFVKNKGAPKETQGELYFWIIHKTKGLLFENQINTTLLLGYKTSFD